ncbi:MAG: OmpH family outer membrane protein [Granulosicoccus sp.]
MNQRSKDQRLLQWIADLPLVAVLFSVTLLSASLVEAEGGNTASSRIGFVDIPYLIDRAPQALEAEQRLETEFAPRQRELEMQRSELAEVVAKLADATLELSEAEYSQLDRESRSLERRIKRSEQDFREELNIQKNNEFKNVRILVLEAIAQFGEQQDYDLIVSDGVLYANKRVDVTERILDSLMKDFTRLQSAN